MSKIITILLSILFILPSVSAKTNKSKLGAGYSFAENGKVEHNKFAKVYLSDRPKVKALVITDTLLSATQRNLQYLSGISETKLFKAGNLLITDKSLKDVALSIVQASKEHQKILFDKYKCYQIKGEDGRGNVHFTGYFTPMLEARHRPDSSFKYPIYALPQGKKKYSRKEIDQMKVLANKGLELAYTSSLLDNYFLSVQGSGILHFKNGQRKFIGYAGQNNLPYRSIGKMLVSSGCISAEMISLRSIRQWFNKYPKQMIPMLNKNPSYTFFKWRNSKISGGAGVPLTAMHSVAVDKSYIPYGACLLAELPVLNDNGRLCGHRWQILFAHDTGGAIRGPGHLDLYHGIGKDAGDRAGNLHHYGRVWIVLPK